MGHWISGAELAQWRDRLRLDVRGSDTSPEEIDWLLEDLSDLERLELRSGLFRWRGRIKLKVSLAELEALWQQRLGDRVPLQYLSGVAPWREFTLSVSPAVLIPRPETEELVEVAIAACPDSNGSPAIEHWADLGTGSGAIALAIAKARPGAIVHAVDASAAALEVARRNAERWLPGDRLQFYCGSWFAPLDGLRGQLRAMVSNPPYIPSAEIDRLDREVAGHEPRAALDGGPDGLDCIRQLVERAPTYLKPGGLWLVEMMAGQGPAVVELLRENGNYTDIRLERDMAGIDRFALAYRRPD